MTDAADVLERAGLGGVTVCWTGAGLVADGPSAAVYELLSGLRQHRHGLVELLAGPRTAAVEAWRERAHARWDAERDDPGAILSQPAADAYLTELVAAWNRATGDSRTVAELLLELRDVWDDPEAMRRGWLALHMALLWA